MKSITVNVWMICGVVLLTGCKTRHTVERAITAEAGAIVAVEINKQKEDLVEFLSEQANIEPVNNGKALKVTFDSGLLFAANSNTINEAVKNTLTKLAESLNNNPDTDIRIVGHTDNTGRIDFNQTLSERRAKRLYDYLCEQGVSPQRMDYSGKGIYEPVADNNTAAGRALNRRIEVLIQLRSEH